MCSFHFSKKSLGTEELTKLQGIVDEVVQSELKMYRKTLPLDVAMGVQGLRTLLDEVYPQNVNVVSIGADVEELLEQTSEGPRSSVELCGGT